MTDAAEMIHVLTFSTDGENTRTAYRRADLPRPEDAAEIERLRAQIEEATHPDFIWGALDNVHDAETTLDDYADAVSRAQRAAIESLTT